MSLSEMSVCKLIVMAGALDDLEDGAFVGGVVVAELGCSQVLCNRSSGGPARSGPKSLYNVRKWKLFYSGQVVTVEKLGPNVDGGRGRTP